jgi:hypothetical protein
MNYTYSYTVNTYNATEVKNALINPVYYSTGYRFYSLVILAGNLQYVKLVHDDKSFCDMTPCILVKCNAIYRKLPSLTSAYMYANEQY